MTIALGVLTHGHIIFAADSKETWGYGPISDMEKIDIYSHLSTQPDGRMDGRAAMVTGAGNSGYLRYLSQEIIEKFKSSELSIDDFDSYLRRKIRGFNRVHVIPYPDRQADIELIVAAQSAGESRMWVTHMGTVRNIERYATVGSGSLWAQDALRYFHPLLVNQQSAVVIAAYAAFMAKNHDDACGLNTRIISISRENGLLQFASSAAIATAEQSFQTYKQTEQLERLAMMGMPVTRQSGVDSFLSRMRNELAGINFFPLPSWAQPTDSQRPQSPTADPLSQPPSMESPGGIDES
jgi:hypothetical protein